MQTKRATVTRIEDTGGNPSYRFSAKRAAMWLDELEPFEKWLVRGMKVGQTRTFTVSYEENE